MNNFPSIFNDIIGPVMRGPSSSHTAASWRIAKLCKIIFQESISGAIIEFDEDGSWASNYLEQGTAMGINGGLLGLDILDDRMKNCDAYAKERGINIEYKISSFETQHTNTVRITLKSLNEKKMQFIGISTGGGAFEILKIDNFSVNIKGNSYELLIIDKKTVNEENLKELGNEVEIIKSSNNDFYLYNIKSTKPFNIETIEFFKKEYSLYEVTIIEPILPVVLKNSIELPFNSIKTLLEFAEQRCLDLGDIGLFYEKAISFIKENILVSKMEEIIKTIEKSMVIGLEGTHYGDRILHRQSHLIKQAEESGRISKNVMVNNIVSNVTAIMESKSSLEVIVANPTAGSCGVVGGMLRAVADEFKSTPNELNRAYFSAGMIGVYFAKGPGFSAEEYGCQVECGAASGMAAAGIVQLMGGSAREAIKAASLAIQNMIGLICDPVADRVEVPCLGKNINAAMNALSSATMACAGFDDVIPLEEVIKTVQKVGSDMPKCIKCTGKGGLSLTDSAIQIKRELERKTSRVITHN